MKRRSTEMLNEAIAKWIVLLVDDTQDNLTVAKTAFRFYGAQVYTATNGEEGLELLKTVKPTVILMDIRMPKMNGWEMFESVRGNPQFKHIPIIAITALAMDADKTKVLDAGFDGYISKPFDVFTFVSDIERYVTQSSQKQQQSENITV